MRNFKIGPLDFRSLDAPRFYLRLWRFVVMYWPRERWHKRLEFVWR